MVKDNDDHLEKAVIERAKKVHKVLDCGHRSSHLSVIGCNMEIGLLNELELWLVRQNVPWRTCSYGSGSMRLA